MPLADLHGQTMTFKDADDNPVTFEVVRIGTVKELETVKAAVETARDVRENMAAKLNEVGMKLDATTEKLATAEAAYKAEKEVHAGVRAELITARNDFATAKGDNETQAATIDVLRDKLAHEQSEHERTGNALSTEKEVNAELQQANDNVAAALESARGEIDKLGEQNGDLCNQAGELQVKLEASSDAFCTERDDAVALRSELASVRAQADVVTIERDDTKASFVALTERQARSETALLGAERERDASRQALADLKAELLEDSNNLSAVLDVIFKKITPE